MKKIKFFPKVLPYFLSASLLGAAYLVNAKYEKPLMFISKQDQSLNFNSSFFTYFNLGLKRLISSTLWVSTILESDIEHYKKADLNSWMFLRFNTISILEPNFYEDYSFGGVYLSIIKDDIPGATVIYNKGLQIYPDDYSLLKDAAFHFHFEARDYERSYQIHSKLIKHPKVTAVVLSNLARMENERGNPEIAFQLLSTKLSQLKDQKSFFATKIKEQLYSLKAEIDLECLNRNKGNCAYYDYNNRPYLKKNDTYYAEKPWTPLKIKRKPL